ncbi:hypothetical protein [Aestuariispira insulae]|uniref:MotA/TolQ/ExbB proton channel family protein n=1 Tax=Aestuariispira insulae TaxID=1461337 RepID=A0A3D9HVV2_9PROT|nr:hypothetical protein [Aestuariispira insulae]RED53549.1 hypothetical protein DFP90_101340 [Aestuariispira insulae]
MKQLAPTLGNASRTLSYLLGGVVVTLAIAAMTTSLSIQDIAQWMGQVLGPTFVTLLTIMVAGTLFCWVNILRRTGETAVWLEAGMHAANGITTLALTFTLLGISLGIGTLADQTLTPETVQEVIRGLTAQFSLAFLTTVIGLPLAALLRALILVTYTNIRAKQARMPLLTGGQ